MLQTSDAFQLLLLLDSCQSHSKSWQSVRQICSIRKDLYEYCTSFDMIVQIRRILGKNIWNQLLNFNRNVVSEWKTKQLTIRNMELWEHKYIARHSYIRTLMCIRVATFLLKSYVHSAKSAAQHATCGCWFIRIARIINCWRKIIILLTHSSVRTEAATQTEIEDLKSWPQKSLPP